MICEQTTIIFFDHSFILNLLIINIITSCTTVIGADGPPTPAPSASTTTGAVVTPTPAPSTPNTTNTTSTPVVTPTPAPSTNTTNTTSAPVVTPAPTNSSSNATSTPVVTPTPAPSTNTTNTTSTPVVTPTPTPTNSSSNTTVPPKPTTTPIPSNDTKPKYPEIPKIYSTFRSMSILDDKKTYAEKEIYNYNLNTSIIHDNTTSIWNFTTGMSYHFNARDTTNDKSCTIDNYDVDERYYDSSYYILTANQDKLKFKGVIKLPDRKIICNAFEYSEELSLNYYNYTTVNGTFMNVTSLHRDGMMSEDSGNINIASFRCQWDERRHFPPACAITYVDNNTDSVWISSAVFTPDRFPTYSGPGSSFNRTIVKDFDVVNIVQTVYFDRDTNVPVRITRFYDDYEVLEQNGINTTTNVDYRSSPITVDWVYWESYPSQLPSFELPSNCTNSSISLKFDWGVLETPLPSPVLSSTFSALLEQVNTTTNSSRPSYIFWRYDYSNSRESYEYRSTDGTDYVEVFFNNQNTLNQTGKSFAYDTGTLQCQQLQSSNNQFLSTPDRKILYRILAKNDIKGWKFDQRVLRRTIDSDRYSTTLLNADGSQYLISLYVFANGWDFPIRFGGDNATSQTSTPLAVEITLLKDGGSTVVSHSEWNIFFYVAEHVPSIYLDQSTLNCYPTPPLSYTSQVSLSFPSNGSTHSFLFKKQDNTTLATFLESSKQYSSNRYYVFNSTMSLYNYYVLSFNNSNCQFVQLNQKNNSNSNSTNNNKLNSINVDESYWLPFGNKYTRLSDPSSKVQYMGTSTSCRQLNTRVWRTKSTLLNSSNNSTNSTIQLFNIVDYHWYKNDYSNDLYPACVISQTQNITTINNQTTTNITTIDYQVDWTLLLENANLTSQFNTSLCVPLNSTSRYYPQPTNNLIFKSFVLPPSGQSTIITNQINSNSNSTTKNNSSTIINNNNNQTLIGLINNNLTNSFTATIEIINQQLQRKYIVKWRYSKDIHSEQVQVFFPFNNTAVTYDYCYDSKVGGKAQVFVNNTLLANSSTSFNYTTDHILNQIGGDSLFVRILSHLDINSTTVNSNNVSSYTNYNNRVLESWSFNNNQYSMLWYPLGWNIFDSSLLLNRIPSTLIKYNNNISNSINNNNNSSSSSNNSNNNGTNNNNIPIVVWNIVSFDQGTNEDLICPRIIKRPLVLPPVSKESMSGGILAMIIIFTIAGASLLGVASFFIIRKYYGGQYNDDEQSSIMLNEVQVGEKMDGASALTPKQDGKTFFTTTKSMIPTSIIPSSKLLENDNNQEERLLNQAGEELMI
ncbi:putative transmembrane protein [Cavenderia fasciculata]|uniref:Transmembrane protein n=1 Tax=Cavenderia fasciculata TaxID=261658 RepID=F4PKX3_CACFS|nr:putative transmembrane protein [Cavenderia fasciculata]EGG23195.1 putative transmembrane protein [Cavenderia fasciculata]|eukprot:XP_004361046.1 putative transmembrane protein [Cavenderia fasciculata]